MLNRILAVLGALLVAAFLLFWFTGKKAEIKLAKPVASIGTSTMISVQTDDPVGVKAFSAAVEQNGQTQTVYENKTNTSQKTMIFTFSAGKKQVDFLKEGVAKLVVKAQTNDLRGATTTFTQDVNVVLRPPTIVADSKQHYINQGGMELVILDAGGNWVEAGVRVANYKVGSFPMPGQPENSPHRFSMFPFPWNVAADAIPLAYAANAAGTEVTTTFSTKIFPKSFRTSDINVTDRDLTKVVGELDPDGQGSLIERFVRLNKDLRQSNTQQIYELRKKTENKILWSGPFIPMKGTRESFFADRRSYIYQGKKVDEQTHLGYDLAQTNNSPVKAANSGRVIWADRLGIYGNCVIIDHGYSLQSLYGHMSRLMVKDGDMVQKEQQIGISGATGMAFGDHVHFSMLIDGYQVDPKEWWDEHWIHDRILSKIGPEPGK